MSSPFSPDRFVHGASCLPCCAPNVPAPPGPNYCACDLPLYEWGVLNTGSVFEAYSNAANAIANRTANALVAGFISAQELELETIFANYDPLAVSPEFNFGGSFTLPGIGLSGVFMDFWASLSMQPNASFAVAWNVSGNALEPAAAFVSVYDCNSHALIAFQEDEEGAFSGNFTFANGNVAAGGEFYIHCEIFAQTFQNDGSTFLSALAVTSNNRFTVGQPIAQISPDANIVLDELRSRPGFDRVFANNNALDSYLDTLQANCLVGVFGTEVVGVNVNAISASQANNAVEFAMTYDDKQAFIPIGLSLNLNAGDLVTVNVLDFPLEVDLVAELLDRSSSAVWANNSVFFSGSPALMELTSPNRGEYLLRVTHENAGVNRNSFTEQLTISCPNGLQTNPIVPFVQLTPNGCPTIFPCELVP